MPAPSSWVGIVEPARPGFPGQSRGCRHQRPSLSKDIAGVSISNDDLAGVGFDNLKFDVAGVIGDPNVVPEPATLALAGLGLLGLGLSRRRLAFV